MTTKEAVLDALKGVIDPELGLSIIDLGLVYKVDVEEGQVRVEMTLTNPRCPLAGHIAERARKVVEALSGIKGATVELVWDPPWTPERISEEARRRLGFR